MRVLLANLRLLSQPRRLWVVYLFWGLLMWPCLRLARHGGGAFAVLVTIALPGAWIVTTMLEEVSKPFSFCLPNQRDHIRRLVFLVGLVISTMGGLYSALQHGFQDTPLDESLLAVCLGWCFTSATYWAGVALTLALGSGVMMSTVVPVYLGVNQLGTLRPNLDRVLFSHPLLLVSVALFMMATVWRWLGRPGKFRGYCTRPASAVLFRSVHSSEQEERQIAASISLSQPPPALDTYILGHIRQGETPGPVKYLWGMVYTTLLPAFLVVTSKKGMVATWGFLVLAIVLVAGYVPNLAAPFFLMLLTVGANGLDEGSPVFSQTPIGSGRRERFYMTTVFVGVFAGLSTLILMTPTLVLNLLAPVLPPVEIGSSVLTFHRIPLWLPMLSIIVFPVLGLVEFGLHGRQVGGAISLGIWLVVVNLVIFIGVFRPIFVIPLGTLVLVAVLSWLVFILAVHRIAMRSDLGRK